MHQVLGEDELEKQTTEGIAGVKGEYAGILPRNYLEAKERNYTDEEWNDPNERWAKIREDLGGDPVHIETWSGSGNKERIITYPGTTNEDIKANSRYARNMLRYHNAMRKKCHPFLPRTMGWDEELAKYASDYAKLLAKENNCKMSHTFKGHDPAKDMQAGENLSACDPKVPCPKISKDKAARLAVNGWGGEGFDMEWRKHKTGDVTGHYTAMMWKNNKQLGCGMGINVEKGCQVTVCNYRSTPPTNSVGLEKDQVKCTHPINIDDAENGPVKPFYTDAYYGTANYSPSSAYAVSFLHYHNIMRNFCQEGDNLMLWDPILAEYASDYAKKLARKNNCKLSHTFEGHDSYKDLKAGENLASTGGNVDKKFKGKQAPFKVLDAAARSGINGWGGEGYKEDATGGMTGHYTAMMWFNNHKVGCGTGINPDLGDIAGDLKKRTQALNKKKKRRRDFRMKKLDRPTWFQIETPHSPPGDRKPRTNFKDHPRLVEHRKREAAAVEESKKLIHADILKTKAVSKKAIFSQTKELKQWKSNTNHW
eukprot:g8478.t1